MAQQPPAHRDDEAKFLAELARRQREELDRISNEPPRAGQVLGSRFEELITRLPGDTEKAGAVSQLAARIQKRVGRELKRSPAVRVARAVIYGDLPEVELDTILDDLEAAGRGGKLRLAPFAYFVACAKNAFKRYDLAWPTDGTPARRHTQTR